MDLDIKNIIKWGKKQTAAEMRYGSADSTVEEHLLEQCVDPDKHDSPTFYLYYFAKDLSYLRSTGIGKAPVDGRTILFVSGGPGQVNRPGNSNFGDIPGHRVVYFHLRGAGFSQLPASNYYDRFLRTRYAVEDIEAIRKDLLGEAPWTAVIGHSYGTVLAQQYAAKYGSKNKLKKLILSAPLSQHKTFAETLQFDNLRKIYRSNFFNFLPQLPGLTRNGEIGNTIAVEARNISERADREFGSVHFLIEIYEDLQKQRDRNPKAHDSFQSLLETAHLNYSLAFFKALRRLRHTGWLAHDEDLATGSTENVDTVQQLAGLIIANEILLKKPYSCNTDKVRERIRDLASTRFPEERAQDVALQIKIGQEYFKTDHVNTPRAYYVFTIYDGLNEMFMRTIEDGETDRRAAITSLGGTQSHMNKALNTIAVENDPINRWDPRQYGHAVPTLILKGDADPVTEGGQADYVFEHALTGDHALFKFPGIGHSMSLPRLIEKDEKGNTTNRNTRDYLLEEFVSHGFKHLEHVVLPKLQHAFDEPLQKMTKDGVVEAGDLKVKAQFKYQ
jgi:pimeloyl-ACP methyl ester carboxylesterase